MTADLKVEAQKALDAYDKYESHRDALPFAGAMEGLRKAVEMQAPTEWRCPDTGRTCTTDDCGKECIQGAAEAPEAAAWLITGGRLYKDQVVLLEASADDRIATRADGSTKVPLFKAQPKHTGVATSKRGEQFEYDASDEAQAPAHGRMPAGSARALIARLTAAVRGDDGDEIEAAMTAVSDALQRPWDARFAAAIASTAPAHREPLTDAQIEQGRRDTFSTDNPFCPFDCKTMRKAVRWAERIHGIKGL